jgi:hypothetical protein
MIHADAKGELPPVLPLVALPKLAEVRFLDLKAATLEATLARLSVTYGVTLDHAERVRAEAPVPPLQGRYSLPDALGAALVVHTNTRWAIMGLLTQPALAAAC